jgi:hypothetical protein
MGWPTGYVPTSSEWAESQSAKADYPVPVDQGGTGGQTVAIANDHLQQRVLIAASPAALDVLTRYAVKTLVGAFTLNLPPIGAFKNGDWIDIVDADGNAGVNNITINASSGQNIRYNGSVSPSAAINISGCITTLVVEAGQWNMVSTLSNVSGLTANLPVQYNGSLVLTATSFNFAGSGVVVTDGGAGVANVVVLGSSVPPTYISGTAYTLVLADFNQYLITTNAAAVTITVPAEADVNFPIGAVISFEQHGDGSLTIAGAGGVLLNSRSGALSAAGKFSVLQVKKVDSDTWTLIGDAA